MKTTDETDPAPTAARLPRREFLSIPELAAAKGVTRVSVLYDVRKRRLRAYRVPGRREWYVPLAAARAYLGLAAA